MSGLVQGNHQADQNVINFMIAHSNLSLFPMIKNMSYEPYICNQSILPNDFCFNISDSIIGVTNNNLNFDEFIINWKAISYEFSLDANRNTSDIEDLFMNNDADEFILECIPEKNQEKI